MKYKIISVCPKTKRDISAYIIKKDNVYLEKKDSDGNIIRALVEKDAGFYELVHTDVYNPTPYKKIVFDVTTRCNLNCPVCYRSNIKGFREPSIDEIKEVVSRYPRTLFLISGGEPTIRDDLPEIIKIFSERTKVILLTNGIKLRDKLYLDRLKDCGLEFVSLAFNGFDDETYRQINGKPLLRLKQQVLENLKEAGIKTLLSFLLARGLNEGQIIKSLRYYIENRDFIKELRIRSLAHVGRYIDKEKYYLSEMIGLLARILSIEKEVLLRELRFNLQLNKLLGKKVFVVSSCSADFHFKIIGNRIVPFGYFLNNPKRGWSRPYLIKKLVELYGVNNLFSAGVKYFRFYQRPCFYRDNIIKIGLRSWPDKYTVDLCERCQTGAFDNNGNLMPFCHANIKKECT